MTTYFVQAQHTWADGVRTGRTPIDGFRIIDYVAGTHEELVLPPNNFRQEELRYGVGRYLVEDDNADAALEGKTVEPVISTQGTDLTRSKITDWKVIA